MIEIDEELTCLSREYLPEWSDCSDILVIHERSSGDGEEMSSLVSCFDDPRATVHFEDAFGYFMENFGDEDEDDEDYDEDDEKGEELFDAIIMDALDPDDCKFPACYTFFIGIGLICMFLILLLFHQSGSLLTNYTTSEFLGKTGWCHTLFFIVIDLNCILLISHPSVSASTQFIESLYDGLTDSGVVRESTSAI